MRLSPGQATVEGKMARPLEAEESVGLHTTAAAEHHVGTMGTAQCRLKPGGGSGRETCSGE